MDETSIVLARHQHRDTVKITLDAREVEPFREVLRQQILGDQELLRDAVAGREDPEVRLHVYDRISLCRRLADRVGLDVVDRRRETPPVVVEDGVAQVRVRLGALGVTLGVILSTLAVYTAWRLTGAKMVSLYVPTVAFCTLRYGRRKGLLCIIGCAIGCFAMPPYAIRSAIDGCIAFSSLLLGLWLIRRDLF